MEQEVRYLYGWYGGLEEEEALVRTQKRAKIWLVGVHKDVERARSHIGLHLQGLARKDESRQCGAVSDPGLPRGCQHRLILDGDGDHFLFSPIFCRTPVSRDIDCYSLVKISEILAGANILPTSIFVTYSAWRAGTMSRYSAGESSPIKAGWPAATAHLVTACGGINTFWET
jgi:hypothetical protein